MCTVQTIHYISKYICMYSTYIRTYVRINTGIHAYILMYMCVLTFKMNRCVDNAKEKCIHIRTYVRT